MNRKKCSFRRGVLQVPELFFQRNLSFEPQKTPLQFFSN
jgi:hypothetical protein